MYKEEHLAATPRPVFNARISLKAIATLVLWAEKKQIDFEKEYGISSFGFRIRTFSQLIREMIESAATNIALKHPEMDVHNTENAIRIIESRGLRIPQAAMTQKPLFRAMQDEYMREEHIERENGITKREMILACEEVKAETFQPDKEEYQRKLEEFEERERIKLEALKNAQDSIIKGEK
jgi:hypothetical protein